MPYTHLFFDLDHTLWDFNNNSAETISDLFNENQLNEKGIPAKEKFLAVYRTINEAMWDEYRLGKINRQTLRNQRFERTLKHFGITDTDLSRKLSEEYIARSPHKGLLFTDALQVLSYLKPKYKLSIITNGFKEVQGIKLKSSGLEPFFDYIFISEEIGFQKPAPEIFYHAMETSSVLVDKCLMIGDNIETDMKGAASVYMDHILFNPEKTEHNYSGAVKEIHSLNELFQLL